MSESKPNVLVISQKFPPEKGGNASRIGDLTHHMSDELDISVVAPPACYPASDFDWSWNWENTETRDGVNVFRLWSWQLRNVNPSFTERLLYYCTFLIHAVFWLFRRRNEYDIVVTTSPPIFTGMVALPFRLSGHVKWVVDIRDLWIDVSTDLGFISKGGIVTGLSHSYQKLELNYADLITVTTQNTISRLRESYQFNTEIDLVPNGVDTDFFEPSEELEQFDLIYTGNIGYGQDLETCIRAIDNMDDNVTFRIVGDGDIRNQMEKLVTNLGIGDQVEFTGLVNREEIPDLLNRSKVGLAPLKDRESLKYAIPTKTYEYMSCKLPVVALGDGQIERLLEDSQAGIMATSDPEQLAQELEELLASKQRRTELGDNGREFVQERYDRRRIALELADQIKKLYKPNNEH